MKLTPFYPPFPIDALPSSMVTAVYEAIDFTQAPPALVAASCIATASLATQNLVDVERRENLVGPTGLFFLTVCASGERKTTVDSMFTRSIREFDRIQDLEYQSMHRDYAAEHAVWLVKKKSAEGNLQRAIRKGLPTEELSECLTQIIKQAPETPIFSPLLLSDATPAAIKKALRTKRSGIGIFSNEASEALNGKTFSEFTLPNELWDGGTVNIDRVTAGRWVIEDCRLTTSLMVQPDAFGTFLARRGKAARDIGLLARMLIAFPPSTQGYRTLKCSPGQESLARFNCRVLELLKEAQRRRMMGEGFRTRLKFHWQAQQLWDEIFNFIETSVRSLGHLVHIKDYAAKYADNLARLAAVFHCFEGLSGEISRETLERAEAIASWYLESFKYLSSPPPALVPLNMQPNQDAELVKNWLANQFLGKGIAALRKKRLAQFGPYRARPVHRLDPALDLLEIRQVICPRIVGPNQMIELHPNFINYLLNQPPGAIAAQAIP